ncbi:pyruvate ferredoxin oxidoreductase [Archaeoglobales archaeon]|nr:MAG: pyruvate ferredoxin oxidoreductase [Archaeoglobales archaeon]
MKKLLTGNHAIAEAVKIAKPDIIAAYPITPQTSIVEKLAEMVENSELDAEFVRVESEYTALSVILGAITAGARGFTATSSQGLLYMYEVCWWVAGSRLPMVMAIATRAVGAPWNIHGDHQDIIVLRDAGWIIGMVESAQEAFDMTLQAFKISEEVSLPFAVGLDGFQLTHTAEVVKIRDYELPKRKPLPYTIEPSSNFALNAVTFGIPKLKARHEQAKDLEKSKEVIRRVDKEFPVSYGGLTEEYRLDDAEYIVVMMGGWCGDAKDAIDVLRDKGIQIGMLRLRFLRPFPRKEVEKLDGKILVVDRSNSDYRGVLGLEVSTVKHDIKNVVTGFGGMELDTQDFVKIFTKFVNNEMKKDVEWWYDSA